MTNVTKSHGPDAPPSFHGVHGGHEGVVNGAKHIEQPSSKDAVASFAVPEVYETFRFVIQGIEKTFTTFHWLIRHRSAHRNKWGAKERTVDGILDETHARLAKLSTKKLAKVEETSGVVMGVCRRHLA